MFAKCIGACLSACVLIGTAQAQVASQGAPVAGSSGSPEGSSGPVGTLNGVSQGSNLDCGRVSLRKAEAASEALRVHDFQKAADLFEEVREMPRCNSDMVIFLSGVAEFHAGDYRAARPLLERVIDIRDPLLAPHQVSHAKAMVQFIDTQVA